MAGEREKKTVLKRLIDLGNSPYLCCYRGNNTGEDKLNDSQVGVRERGYYQILMRFFNWYLGEILSKNNVVYNEFIFWNFSSKKDSSAEPHDSIYIKEEKSPSTHFNVYMNGECVDIMPVSTMNG